MADQDQNDQAPNPPAAFLPLKKRAMAGKTLAAYNRAPESTSESDDTNVHEDVMCLADEDVNEETLQELQLKAFYSLLLTFALETSTVSDKRNQIIEKLMNEWKISDDTYHSVADKIQKNLLTLEQMEASPASDEKAMQIEPESPLTKPATPSSSVVPKAGKSWGSVNPESLIGKWVRIRLHDKAEFEEYTIKKYDAKEEMHCLITADSSAAMEVDDPYSWVDLREVPPEDIMWEGGEKPNFDAPNQSAARRSLF